MIQVGSRCGPPILQPIPIVEVKGLRSSRTVNAKQVRRTDPKESGGGGGTHNPPPELFPNILRRRLIIGIRNHFIQSRNEVHLVRLHEPALHHEGRGGEQDRGEHQWDVIRDEGGRVPVTPKEDGETTEEEDD